MKPPGTLAQCTGLLAVLQSRRSKFDAIIVAADFELLAQAVVRLAEAHRDQPPPGRVCITIETSGQVMTRLEDLAETGLYGTGAAGVAEELMREALRITELP